MRLFLRRSCLLAAILLTASPAFAEVNQRVAVLRFEPTGFTDSFASIHIRNVFERELDRSDRINLIREYLWSKFVETKPSAGDPRSLSEFAMQAKVEAVVCGTIDRTPAGDYAVAMRVFDALASRTVYTDRFAVQLSDSLFKQVESRVRTAVSSITSYFRPMEPREIVKYRKQTKKVFVTADVPEWSFTIGAGADAVKPIFWLPYLTNQGPYSFCTNMQSDNRQFAAFRILADIRWRRLSFTPMFSYGAGGESLHLLGSLDSAFWIVPETVGAGLRFYYMKDRSTGTAFFASGGSKKVAVTTEYLHMAVSARFKASQRVGFGVSVGIPAPLFSRIELDGLLLRSSPPAFPHFLIFADFGITRSLAVRFNMDVLSYSYFYGDTDSSNMTFLAGLMLSWKFDLRGKKP